MGMNKFSKKIGVNKLISWLMVLSIIQSVFPFQIIEHVLADDSVENQEIWLFVK